MEAIIIGTSLSGGAVWLGWFPCRAKMYHAIGAWAFANRDAALVRKARRREYLAAAVEEVRNVG